MIRRSDAVVLRSLKYGETSRIVTLFSRDNGKMSVLAKGARLSKSKFGSTLQPMSYIQVVYYYKPSRTLQMLSESTHLQPFHRIPRDLDRITIGLRLVELTHAVLEEEERNPLIFELLVQVLHYLDEADRRYRNLLPFFQLRLATFLGFSPSIDREAVAGLTEQGGILVLDNGAILPPEASSARMRLSSRAALRSFAILARSDLETNLRMNLSDEVFFEVSSLVEDYLQTHLQESFPHRTERVFSQFDYPPVAPTSARQTP